MNQMLLYYHRSLAQQRAMIQKAHWELYDFSINRQDRKVTIRNIVNLGLPARDAIEMVRNCEQEG